METPVLPNSPSAVSRQTSTTTKILFATTIVLALLLARAIYVQLGRDAAQRKHLTSLSGNWHCRTTLEVDKPFALGKMAQVNEVGIALKPNGEGTYSWQSEGREHDSAQGMWALKEDYLVIRRTGDGFVAFRIASQSENRLVLVNRGGVILEFNKVN